MKYTARGSSDKSSFSSGAGGAAEGSPSSPRPAHAHTNEADEEAASVAVNTPSGIAAELGAQSNNSSLT